MKLRLCTINFKKTTPVIIDDNETFRGKSNSYTIIDLGMIEKDGKVYACGVMSQDITNVKAVKNEIDILESKLPEKRLEWFKKRFPQSRNFLIESSLLFDQFKDKKRKDDPSAVISSAVELKWSK